MEPELKWKNRRLPGPCIYYGGKGGSILSSLLKLIPYTEKYIEPYGGMASVLYTRDPSPFDLYNDLDPRCVNLMEVLKDPRDFDKLYRLAYWTPYSFYEFKRALERLKFAGAITNVEKAWAFFTAQNQSYGGIAKSAGNWGRAFTDDAGVAKKVNTYTIRIDRLPRHHARLKNVHIGSEDALHIIERYDAPTTTVYLDPPYPPSTRVNEKVYKVDQTLKHHQDLVDLLLMSTSAVVLSGYDHSVYLPLEKAGWQHLDLRSYSSAAARNRNSKTRGEGNLLKHAARTEVIWRSPRAVELLPLTIDPKSRIIKKV